MCILTSKSASRHNMPQRRAPFRRLNFHRRSEREVLSAFLLANVLRATTACTFSTSQLLKMVHRWCALYILTWRCASRHNDGQFFISHLATCLRTPQIIGKTQCAATFPPFAHLDLLSSETFSFLIFFLLLFSLSDSSHLCFSSVHIVGSLDF